MKELTFMYLFYTKVVSVYHLCLFLNLVVLKFVLTRYLMFLQGKLQLFNFSTWNKKIIPNISSYCFMLTQWNPSFILRSVKRAAISFLHRLESCFNIKIFQQRSVICASRIMIFNLLQFFFPFIRSLSQVGVLEPLKW